MIMADKYTDAEIEEMGKKGQAYKNPDGHYSYAIKAVGRGGADHDGIRKYLIGRAKAIGKSSMIPDTWNADGSLKDATSSRAPLELRRQRRSAMLAIPERLALSFARGGIEMRAMPNGTGGTSFRFEGYAATFNDPFEMWDMWGEPYTEEVEPGAFTRTLANNADVAFLIGHYDAGILMARTKSGTMQLSQDTRGLAVRVPAMDGSREDVRALASAVDRGDMDEMSCAFVTRQQRWDDSFEHRSMLEMDLHRGDVSAVVFGANPATSGSMMTALPAEALTLRRPVSVRTPTQPYTAHDGETNACPQCQSVNDDTAGYCDQCGTAMRPAGPVSNMQDIEDMTQRCGECLRWNSADAKYCGGCGQELAGDQGRGWDAGFWRAGRPGEKRSADEIVDMSGAPDYNPVPHAYDPAALQCKNSGCPVPGGAKNSPDAKYCDQCSAPLYGGNGAEVVDDSGVVEDIEGASMNDAELLAHHRRELELLELSA
jgi:HK97 family phage prohead protease